jgi:hypothetical protein
MSQPVASRDGVGRISHARRALLDTPVGRLRLPEQKNEQGGYYPRVWAPVMRAGQKMLGPHYYISTMPAKGGTTPCQTSLEAAFGRAWQLQRGFFSPESTKRAALALEKV